jgi:hypothetical protein
MRGLIGLELGEDEALGESIEGVGPAGQSLLKNTSFLLNTVLQARVPRRPAKNSRFDDPHHAPRLSLVRQPGAVAPSERSRAVGC